MDKHAAPAQPVEKIRQSELELLTSVDALSDEVKALALNIALYLAKARADKGSEKLDRLEPKFVRLVNATVRVVTDLTGILKAARNNEVMVYEIPNGRVAHDHIEQRLQGILSQCGNLIRQLTGDGPPANGM
jgi:hypothetical protein